MITIRLNIQALVIIFICCCSSSQRLFAQNVADYIKIGGSINLSDNFYSSSGIDKRQPANVASAIFRTTVTIYNQIQLPFEFYWTSKERKFQQPFNQFGVSPRISSWLTLHGGYFSSRISDLSFGDLRMLGGGVELTPGNFRLKVLYGKSRNAVEPDNSNFLPAVYKQTAYAASIGYGNEATNFFNINLFRAIDDTNSIKRDSSTITPNENLVGSISFGTQIIDELNINGEIGLSAFSSNITAESLKDVSTSSFFFSPNTSSRLDGAAKLNINIRPSNAWSLRLSSRWIGPGFTTLGYALLPNDLMEFSLSPNVRLLDNKLNIRAQAGIRFNNLRSNRLSTTSRFTGSFGANWQVNQNFGFDLNYNNNQIQSSHKNDTLKLSNIFNSISISPRILFEGLGGNNNLIFTYTYQDVSDKNVYTSKVSDNRTHSVSTIHSLMFPSSWSFTTTALFNSTSVSTLSTRIINLSETIGRRFFDNKLSASVSLGLNFIKTTVNDTQLVFRLTSTYSLDKWGNISFNLSNNNYNGTGELTKTYNELYGSLQYNINF